MNYKNYIVPAVSLFAIGFVSFFACRNLSDTPLKTWFILTGGGNVIASIFYMIYNPMYNDMAKPKRVLLGDKMVDNDDLDRPDWSKSTNNPYTDNLGYGFNKPNLAGLIVAVLLLIIGLII